MNTETTAGGFVGDPAEAFNPPAASGCCGGVSTTSDEASTCCGGVATAKSDCCGLPAETGCCG